jgi:hypothetical protein
MNQIISKDVFILHETLKNFCYPLRGRQLIQFLKKTLVESLVRKLHVKPAQVAKSLCPQNMEPNVTPNKLVSIEDIRQPKIILMLQYTVA